MFSDYFEVPPEWKAALKADLERDPPILGQATLGGNLATVPLESLASAGMIGKSGVSITGNGILFGPGSDYVSWGKWTTGIIWTNADWIYMGPSQNLRIGRYNGYFGVSSDIIFFGANYDNAFVRGSAEEIQTYQRISLLKSVTSTETPLVVNCGGAQYNVRVGPTNSAGGIGRQLYIAN